MGDGALKRMVKNSTVLVAMARALRDGSRHIRGRLTRKGAIMAHVRRGGGLWVAIGADDSDREGWLASDYSPRRRGVIYLDATRRFPFADNAVDYFHAEHMIEHVPFAGGRAMLEECFRTLRPGGRVRLATPDLGRLAELLSPAPSAAAAEYAHWSNLNFGDAYEQDRPDLPVSTFNRIMRNWGHTFIYDEATLRLALAEAGFVDIVRCEIGESPDPNLRGIELHGTKIGDPANRFETMILEATKPG